jgi:hypothetical protein
VSVAAIQDLDVFATVDATPFVMGSEGRHAQDRAPRNQSDEIGRIIHPIEPTRLVVGVGDDVATVVVNDDETGHDRSTRAQSCQKWQTGHIQPS